MLQPIPTPPNLDDHQPDAETVAILELATERIDEFTRHQHPPIDNFVVCDFRLVDAALGWLDAQTLLPGDRFLEWGAGFGVATVLAARRGMEAYGIEIEPELVDQAEQFADDVGVEIEIACGSFLPDGAGELMQYIDDAEHIATDGQSAYDSVGHELSDFDLCFAFPWPGEHVYMERVFDHFANPGSLLMTYRGRDGIHVTRKMT